MISTQNLFQPIPNVQRKPHIKKAIVLGHDVGGIGVVRALAMKGIYVIATHDRFASGYASKYVSERDYIPHSREHEKKFIDFLVSNSNKWRGALLLDTDDDVAVSISKNKKELAKYYKIVTADWDILRKFIEKKETFRLSQECNVPHPKTLLPKTLMELTHKKNDIEYPCILKPVLGHEFTRKFHTKNFKVSDDTELLDKFKLCLESGTEVMVQEIIPGPDTSIYKCMVYVNSRGEMSSIFFYNKIRQNPPQFGMMRVGISQGRNEEVAQLSERLLKHSNFKGVCTVEFKKDARDNQLKLMEVNVRMPRMNWLATYCGVNFPWIIYADLVENQQIEVKEYKKNVYWIEFLADIKNSILHHNKENFRLHEYLKPYASKNKTFAVLSKNDLKPFLLKLMLAPIRRINFLKPLFHKNKSLA